MRVVDCRGRMAEVAYRTVNGSDIESQIASRSLFIFVKVHILSFDTTFLKLCCPSKQFVRDCIYNLFELCARNQKPLRPTRHHRSVPNLVAQSEVVGYRKSDGFALGIVFDFGNGKGSLDRNAKVPRKLPSIYGVTSLQRLSRVCSIFW